MNAGVSVGCLQDGRAVQLESRGRKMGRKEEEEEENFRVQWEGLS